MSRNRLLLAWGLIFAGVLIAADRLVAGAGWLWTGLAGAGFLTAYSRQRVRGLMVLGCVLLGVAGGLALGGAGLRGGFFVALGVALMAIDRIEPDPDKRIWRVGVALALFGALVALVTADWLQDARLAVALILAGALLWFDRERGARHDTEPVADAGPPDRPGPT